MNQPPANKHQNPFLSGNWAPLSPSSITSADGVPAKCIRGNIPNDLCGSFLRVGPSLSPKQNIDTNSYHLFAGDGFIVGLEFNNGGVIQRCRWIDAPSGMGAGNTAMVYHSSRLLTLSEGSKPYEVALPTCETIGMYDFNQELMHNVTAHPKVCAETNELIFFGYSFGENDLRYTVASENGTIAKTTNSVLIPFRQPVFAPTPHDIAITRHYSIFLDFPLWDMAGATKIEDGSLFGVIPRHPYASSAPIWFRDKGQFGYHVANAYESQDKKMITLFMCTGINFDFRSSNKKNMLLRQWKLDMSSTNTRNHSSKGTQTNPILTKGNVICDIPCEFPVIDKRRTGLSFQYIWASCLSQRRHAAPLACDAILRHDVTSSVSTKTTLPKGYFCGEVRFVPSRKKDLTRGGEGEGYLVLLAHDPNLVSYALVYDALFECDSKPIAVVELSIRVPNGFHALWVDYEQYDDGANTKNNSNKMVVHGSDDDHDGEETKRSRL